MSGSCSIGKMVFNKRFWQHCISTSRRTLVSKPRVLSCCDQPIIFVLRPEHSQNVFWQNHVIRFFLKIEKFSHVFIILPFSKPKTQRGKRALAKREPKIVENFKQALMLRGATASATSLQFVKDLVSSYLNLLI